MDRARLSALAGNAPEAFGLTDDAAAIPARPGFDLIVSKDAIVEGVHFLAGDAPDLVARKLVRVNLSDLAAKGAEPYGYFLAVAWPATCCRLVRERMKPLHAVFEEDQTPLWLEVAGRRHGRHARGQTLTASLTILGWTLAGRMVRRAGAVGRRRILLGQRHRGRRLARAAVCKGKYCRNILRTVELARGSLSPAPAQAWPGRSPSPRRACGDRCLRWPRR